ncbi:TPA: AbrB/MazE/SpoVT family DNA-binding domain-containing protein, partial [Clostridioides difficile]|nr:AbrB/MazE/SpoVT family DNA-binding domain-containing protein [Clostridioides difficile]
MILLEQRKLRIGFNKSGKGSFTPRLILPMSWIKEMNISPDERDVLVTFEDGKIIIEK